VQLTANVEPAGATNKTVTWESKNTEFATVDSETGVVTGVAAGTATIEVTTQDGSHKATATVEVTAAQE
ncbi:TPA: Ig domain-containing protein, partial [Escherichia coli]